MLVDSSLLFFSLCHSRAKRRIPEAFLWPFLRVIQSRCGEESRESFFLRRSTQSGETRMPARSKPGRVELKLRADTRTGILRSADSALNDTKTGERGQRTRGVGIEHEPQNPHLASPVK